VKESQQQFGRFVVGGAVNTAITYIAYLALEVHMAPSIAYSIIYVLGIALSYAINTYFVFRTKSSTRSGLQYPFVYGAQYLFGLALLSLLTRYGIDSRIAMIVVIAASVPLTFLLTRIVLKGTSRRSFR
jgi:putative flippase GtrA